MTEDIEHNFIESLSDRLCQPPLNEETSNNTINEKLVSDIKKCADTILPKVEIVRNKQPWHNDAKLQELFDKKDELRNKNADRKQLITLRKKIRQRARYLKNEHFKKKAEKINQLAVNRELEKLFHRARNQRTTLKPVTSTCPKDKLLSHFKNHFNPADPSDTRTTRIKY